MAVVREFVTAQGVRVRVHDDCYRDISPEEKEKRKAATQAVMGRIAWSIAEKRFREQQERQKKEEA